MGRAKRAHTQYQLPFSRTCSLYNHVENDKRLCGAQTLPILLYWIKRCYTHPYKYALIAIYMDGELYMTKKKRISLPHGRPYALRVGGLTTADLAILFQVKEDTIRHWIYKDILTLTGNSLQDLVTILKLLDNKNLLEDVLHIDFLQE